MRKVYPLVTLLCLFLLSSFAFAREAKLVRYPSYSNGRIAFTYLGDIWTADENGQNVQRLTVNKARDAYPRFSPDGKWIAFSSDRNGNLDVFIIPAGGGTAKQLTSHSADDTVLGWTPDGRGVLFSSQRGEDFMGMLYVVSVDGGMPWRAGPTWVTRRAFLRTASASLTTRRDRFTGASIIAALIKPTSGSKTSRRKSSRS